MTPLTDDTLIDAIEYSMTLMPELPGRMDNVSFPGITISGRVTQIPHPFANIVAGAQLGEKPEEQVAEIRSFYWERNLPFAWVVGPRTRPENITSLLAEAELFPGSQMAGLVLRDIGVPFSCDPAIRVRETDPNSPEDIAFIARIAASGFDFPLPLCELFAESFCQPQVRCRSYLAYAPDSEEPQAFAATIYISDSPIVLLGGAATVPEGRGKGLYQALVARRLADAHADGRQAAVIQAVRTTSAPILMKRGFEELASLEMWIGLPPGMRDSAPPAEA